LGYLDAVGPDPLVAALVTIGRCRMLEFGFDSATTRATVEAASDRRQAPRPEAVRAGMEVRFS
jgi:hypothetical protein